MKWLMIPIGFFLFLGGCRVSVTAEKLSLSLQADEPGYLTVDDPTLYTTEDERRPDPVN